jgi:Ni/Co efflux regulator RcnB
MRTLILASFLLAPAAWAAGMYDGTYHGQLTADGSNATNCAKSAPIQMTVTNDQLEYHRPTDPDRYRPDHRRWHRGQGVAQQFLRLRDGAEEVPVTIR